MRLFYFDEAPIDTLLQIAARPVGDGDLISKSARDVFVQLDWAARCHGFNVITEIGRKTVHALRLCRAELFDYGASHLAPLMPLDRLQQIMVEIDGGKTTVPGLCVGKLTNYGAGCIIAGLEQAGFMIGRAGV